jgi:hypothetical protein
VASLSLSRQIISTQATTTSTTGLFRLIIHSHSQSNVDDHHHIDAVRNVSELQPIVHPPGDI